MDMPFIIEVKGENGKLKSMVSATHIYKTRAKRTTLFSFHLSVFSSFKNCPV